MVKSKINSKYVLEEQCGLTKLEFQKEYRRLTSGWHMLYQFEMIRLRTLLLDVRDKKSQRFIKEIPLNYLNRFELNKVIRYDERHEDFIEGVQLTQDHQAYFEATNDIKFDFKRSEYWLKVAYVDINHNPLQGLGGYSDWKIPVVHVDQYELFAKGLEMIMQNSFYEDFDWHHFTNPGDALVYIEQEFRENKYLHFIITDITFRAGSGIEFALAVKGLEEKYNYRHTPVIAFTMHDETSPVMVQAKIDNNFTAHFTKDVDIEILKAYVNKIES